MKYHDKAVLLCATTIWLIVSITFVILAPTVMVHRWNVTELDTILYPGSQTAFVLGGASSANLYVDSLCSESVVSYEYPYDSLPPLADIDSTTEKQRILTSVNKNFSESTFSECFRLDPDAKLSCSFELSSFLAVYLIEKDYLRAFEEDHTIEAFIIFKNIENDKLSYINQADYSRFLCFVSFNGYDNTSVTSSTRCTVTSTQYDCSKKEPLNTCREKSCKYINVSASNEIIANYEIKTGKETEPCQLMVKKSYSEFPAGAIAVLVIFSFLTVNLTLLIILILCHWRISEEKKRKRMEV